jgi:micrococcal nuclease
VVHVQDGDTLSVLSDKKQVKVRLDSIDAPESKQAFGQRSKQSLLEICGGRELR